MTGSTAEDRPRSRSASRLGSGFFLATLLYYWAGLELVPRVFSFGLFWPTWVFYALVALAFGIALTTETIRDAKSFLDSIGSVALGMALGGVLGVVSLYVFTSILQEIVQLDWLRAFVWGVAGLVAGILACAAVIVVIAVVIIAPFLLWQKVTGQAVANSEQKPSDTMGSPEASES